MYSIIRSCQMHACTLLHDELSIKSSNQNQNQLKLPSRVMKIDSMVNKMHRRNIQGEDYVLSVRCRFKDEFDVMDHRFGSLRCTNTRHSRPEKYTIASTPGARFGGDAGTTRVLIYGRRSVVGGVSVSEF